MESLASQGWDYIHKGEIYRTTNICLPALMQKLCASLHSLFNSTFNPSTFCQACCESCSGRLNESFATRRLDALKLVWVGVRWECKAVIISKLQLFVCHWNQNSFRKFRTNIQTPALQRSHWIAEGYLNDSGQGGLLIDLESLQQSKGNKRLKSLGSKGLQPQWNDVLQ